MAVVGARLPVTCCLKGAKRHTRLASRALIIPPRPGGSPSPAPPHLLQPLVATVEQPHPQARAAPVLGQPIHHVHICINRPLAVAAAAAASAAAAVGRLPCCCRACCRHQLLRQQDGAGEARPLLEDRQRVDLVAAKQRFAKGTKMSTRVQAHMQLKHRRRLLQAASNRGQATQAQTHLM